MSTTSSPTVARWELALRLGKLAADRDLVLSEAGIGSKKWAQICAGDRIIAAELLAELVQLLEVSDTETAELSELRSCALRRGWWAPHETLSADVQRFLGLEAGARGVRGYESAVWPGLLQTPDYNRALYVDTLHSPATEGMELEQLLQVRRERQQRIGRQGDPLLFHAIVSESVLYQQVGGAQVWRTQLDHVRAMIEKHPDTIEVRVLPFRTPAAPDLVRCASLWLMDFSSTHLPGLAWHEDVATMGLIDDPLHVRELTAIYTMAGDAALSQEESLEMIAAAGVR